VHGIVWLGLNTSSGPFPYERAPLMLAALLAYGSAQLDASKVCSGLPRRTLKPFFRAGFGPNLERLGALAEVIHSLSSRQNIARLDRS
jgi:hypothetical protein